LIDRGLKMTIQSEARDRNELVYEFDQSESDVMKQPGPWGSAWDGYCAGLALHWIKLRNEGKDYASGQDGKMIPDLLPTTLAQNLRDEFPVLTVMPQLGLTPQGNVSKPGAPDATHIVNQASQVNGTWYVALRRAGGVGHAVALQVDSRAGEYRFFDANYGEFKFASAERLKEWLAQFLIASGYAARYTVRTELYRAH
jgi:hypothetical protein